MRLLGLLLLVFGVGTTVLYFTNTPVSWLEWIGTWGENVAWGIRGGSAVLGGVLMAAGKKKDGKKK